MAHKAAVTSDNRDLEQHEECGHKELTSVFL